MQIGPLFNTLGSSPLFGQKMASFHLALLYSLMLGALRGAIEIAPPCTLLVQPATTTAIANPHSCELAFFRGCAIVMNKL